MTAEKQRVGLDLGMGWVPDYPDFRDFSMETATVADRARTAGEKESIGEMIDRLKLTGPPTKLKAGENLRHWCSGIENQGRIGSCTAQAGVAIVEYYERRAFGRHIDASRLFLYKATRNLLHLTGDTGANIRATMGALALFGVPPEQYWPYTDQQPDFDTEPSAFCYAFAQNYQALQYFRLDGPQGMDRKKLLARIKQFLAAGLPSMFGFSVYSSISQAAEGGQIPFPCRGDAHMGGHAVVAVGFDDELEIENQDDKEAKTTGALLIRNSWGTQWGEKGYGWLPYQYVLEGLAVDWWTLLKSKWVETGKFGL